jgi:glycosyltransferase involved in cell wall biosynthesis
MLRVLQIVTRLDAGGSTDDLLLLATRLPRSEFATNMISGPTLDPPPALAETLASAGVPWVQVPQLRRPVNPLLDLRALGALWRSVRTHSPDIVHTHTSKAGFVGRLAARLAGVRRILHTPHGHIFHGYYGRAATRAFITLERLAARWTERIIALTNAEAAQYLAAGIGRSEQFVTIPRGVDLAQAQAAAAGADQVRRALDLPPQACLIGSVSRLAPIKGLSYLIAAMPAILQRCPGVHLVITGDGEERVRLATQVAGLGLVPRVHFLGWREDPEAVIAALDVFVLPSLNEGLGKVLVTAMALGVPAVASRVGGVPDVIEDGRQGLLVPAADSAALAAAVVTLLGDRPRASAMGDAGRARAPLFSADLMLKCHADLYREEALRAK